MKENNLTNPKFMVMFDKETYLSKWVRFYKQLLHTLYDINIGLWSKSYMCFIQFDPFDNYIRNESNSSQH